MQQGPTGRARSLLGAVPMPRVPLMAQRFVPRLALPGKHQAASLAALDRPVSPGDGQGDDFPAEDQDEEEEDEEAGGEGAPERGQGEGDGPEAEGDDEALAALLGGPDGQGEASLGALAEAVAAADARTEQALRQAARLAALASALAACAARLDRTHEAFGRYQALLAQVRQYFASLQTSSHNLLLRTANLKQLAVTLQPLLALLTLPATDLRLYSAVVAPRAPGAAPASPVLLGSAQLEAARRVEERVGQLRLCAQPLHRMAAVRARAAELAAMHDGWGAAAERALGAGPGSAEPRLQWLAWLQRAHPARHRRLFLAYQRDEAGPRWRQRVRELVHQLGAAAEKGDDTRFGHMSGREQALRARERLWAQRLAAGQGPPSDVRLRFDEALVVLLEAAAAWAVAERRAAREDWGLAEPAAIDAHLQPLLAPLRPALQSLLRAASARSYLYLLPVISACRARSDTADKDSALGPLAADLGREAEAMLAQWQDDDLRRLAAVGAPVTGFSRYLDLLLRLQPPPALLGPLLERIAAALFPPPTSPAPVLSRLQRVWAVRRMAAEAVAGEEGAGPVRQVFLVASEGLLAQLAAACAAAHVASAFAVLRYMEEMEALARRHPLDELQFQSSHSRGNTQAFVAALTPADFERRVADLRRHLARDLSGEPQLAALVWAEARAQLAERVGRYEVLLARAYRGQALQVSAPWVQRCFDALAPP